MSIQARPSSLRWPRPPALSAAECCVFICADLAELLFCRLSLGLGSIPDESTGRCSFLGKVDLQVQPLLNFCPHFLNSKPPTGVTILHNN